MTDGHVEGVTVFGGSLGGEGTLRVFLETVGVRALTGKLEDRWTMLLGGGGTGRPTIEALLEGCFGETAYRLDARAFATLHGGRSLSFRDILRRSPRILLAEQAGTRAGVARSIATVRGGDPRILAAPVLAGRRPPRIALDAPARDGWRVFECRGGVPAAPARDRLHARLSGGALASQTLTLLAWATRRYFARDSRPLPETPSMLRAKRRAMGMMAPREQLAGVLVDSIGRFEGMMPKQILAALADDAGKGGGRRGVSMVGGVPHVGGERLTALSVDRAARSLDGRPAGPYGRDGFRFPDRLKDMEQAVSGLALAA